MKENQIIKIVLTKEEVDLAYEVANGLELGGKSNAREDREDRMKSLSDDQIVGQLGTMALHKYMFGNLREYQLSTWIGDQYLKPKRLGDGGFDVPGCTIDVKSTHIRLDSNRPLMRYRLIVSKNERHNGWTYVLCIIDSPYNRGSEVTANLMGWASDDELPPMDTGELNGSHAMFAEDLNPLPPIKWCFR